MNALDGKVDPLCLASQTNFSKSATLWGRLHKTFTGEKTLVISENSGKDDFTIDYSIGRKLRLKLPDNRREWALNNKGSATPSPVSCKIVKSSIWA